MLFTLFACLPARHGRFLHVHHIPHSAINTSTDTDILIFLFHTYIQVNNDVTGGKLHGPLWPCLSPRWARWLRSLKPGWSLTTTSHMSEETRWTAYMHNHHIIIINFIIVTRIRISHKLVGGWNKVCQAKFCCLLFKNNATELVQSTWYFKHTSPFQHWHQFQQQVELSQHQCQYSNDYINVLFTINLIIDIYIIFDNLWWQFAQSSL